ncbi:PP2C family protein-serine/threonine phosphatase [Azotosporobacter soli]|uniref:PP2C family protein-serine/threonine phosphatase n=1 Tax=Azotosporobacter soli TaxID=3055040 RepID=UPI0031FE9907
MFKIMSSLLNTACVMSVIAYFLTRTQFYSNILEKKKSRRQQALLVAVFGLFSLYGAFNAIPFYGGLVSLRPTGPILGGLIGGPWVGLGVGLIGGIDRFLQGGASVWSATLATVLAGLFAGLYAAWRKKDDLVSVTEAVSFTVFYEMFASGLTFLFLADFAKALAIEQGIRLPLIIGNAIAVATFIFITKNLIAERKNQETKKRIESELQVARNIQMSMVPKIFPAFPNIKELDIYAYLSPAKEVGGDLYDFFFIDDDHFCFLIGDVSGKGVPASLFMAVTKTLIRAKARPGIGSEELLFKTNSELCRGNEETMFVTMFCAILNIKTGEVTYSNGGHNPPYLHRADGSLNAIPCTPGVALGILDDFSYDQQELRLEPGDRLVIYTDGVTEAQAVNEEQFTTLRLEQAIQKCPSSGARTVVNEIVEAVETFSNGAEQFDDITILVLEYRGTADEA